MPTYGFRCPDGHEFDRFFKTISAAPASVDCPECGKVSERQLHGGAGLLFKGSGFYLTDYGKNAHRGEGTKTGSGSTSEAKSESKAETKSESPAPKADSAAPKAEAPKPKADAKPAKKPKAE